MKLKAMGVSNLDKSKADPNVRHKYVPDVTFRGENGESISNRSLPEDEQVFVICDHITVSDGDRYNRIRTDSTFSFAGVDVWRDKVKELHNLTHPTEDREMTPAELLNVYGSSDALAIKADVVNHLMKASNLEDAEVKN